jgi:hypothetical protein
MLQSPIDHMNREEPEKVDLSLKVPIISSIYLALSSHNDGHFLGIALTTNFSLTIFRRRRYHF